MRAGGGGTGLGLRKRAKRIKLTWASKMRRNPTKGEAAIWEQVRSGRLGLKFRRQAILRGYIVDFWCPKARLVVEVDGGYHQTAEQRQWDAHRDAALAALGIYTLRLRDDHVLADTQRACSTIFALAIDRLRALETARSKSSGRASSEAAVRKSKPA